MCDFATMLTFKVAYLIPKQTNKQKEKEQIARLQRVSFEQKTQEKNHHVKYTL